MEDRTHVGDETESVASKKSANFMTRWLRRREFDAPLDFLMRRQQETSEYSEDTEEDEETEKTPGSVRRIVKRFLKGLVQVRPAESEKIPDDTKEQRPSSEEMIKGAAETSSGLQGELVIDHTDDEVHTSREPSFESQYTAPLAGVEIGATTAPEINTDELNTAFEPDLSYPEVPPLGYEAATPTDHVETPPTVVSSPELDVPPVGEMMLPEPLPYGPELTRTGFVSLAPPERTAHHEPVHTETIVERNSGGALAAFLGADILSRRRDKKLKHELKRQQSAIKGLQQERTRAERIAPLASIERTTSPEVRLAGNGVSASPGERFSSPAPRIDRTRSDVAQSGSERPIVRGYEQERQRIEASQRLEAGENYRAPELVQAQMNRAPEAVLEAVAKAAEKDLPVEREYELRHEAKDDMFNPQAASVGSVLRERYEQQQRSAAYPNGALDQYSQSVMGSRVGTAQSKNELYAQAMKRGFWAAMVLLGFATVAYLAVG